MQKTCQLKKLEELWLERRYWQDVDKTSSEEQDELSQTRQFIIVTANEAVNV